VTRGRRIAVEDECPLKWCNEAGDHHVHRRYLASLMTRDGLVLGVNVVQVDRRPRAVELTIVSLHSPNQIVTLLPTEADAITKGMQAAVRLAGSEDELSVGEGE
jgi:hypothetical protein